MCPAIDALRAQARHYRRLSAMMTDAKAPEVLLAMAAEHEEQADLIEAGRRRARAV